MIKELILMHQDLIWAGGYHLHSEVYCQFQYKMERIMKMFALPCSSDMISLVFGVPLSQFIDIDNPCSVDTCPQKAKEMLYLYMDTVRSGAMQPYRKYPNLWTINERVEAVYDNLMTVSGTGYPVSD
jgi:hypothetical protein